VSSFNVSLQILSSLQRSIRPSPRVQ